MELDDPNPSCGLPHPPRSPTEAVSVSPQGTPQNSPTDDAFGGGGFVHTPPDSPQRGPTFPCTPEGGNSPHPPSLPRKGGLEATSHSSANMATFPPRNGRAFDMFSKPQVSRVPFAHCVSGSKEQANNRIYESGMSSDASSRALDYGIHNQADS